MKPYKTLFIESTEEKEFSNIIKKFKPDVVKYIIKDNFGYITLKSARGSRGQGITVGGKDTMLGQDIKNISKNNLKVSKEIINLLNKSSLNIEDISVEGDQNNSIFIVSDNFFDFKIKSRSF